MTGDSQARFCEGLGVKFPGTTRPSTDGERDSMGLVVQRDTTIASRDTVTYSLIYAPCWDKVATRLCRLRSILSPSDLRSAATEA